MVCLDEAFFLAGEVVDVIIIPSIMAVPNGTIIDAKWRYFNLWVANSYSCGYRDLSEGNWTAGKAGLLVLLSRYTGGTLRSFPYVHQCALMFANSMVLHGFQRVCLFACVTPCSQYNHNVMILMGNI